VVGALALTDLANRDWRYIHADRRAGPSVHSVSRKKAE